MPDFDFAPRGPLRVCIAHAGHSRLNVPGDFVRVRGADLRDVSHHAAEARDAKPGAVVLVDIDVTIAHSAHRARQIHSDVGPPESSDTLLYVGTPIGLAGLLTDIHALGITDGAVLIPSTLLVHQLITADVLPALSALAGLPVDHARPA